MYQKCAWKLKLNTLDAWNPLLWIPKSIRRYSLNVNIKIKTLLQSSINFLLTSSFGDLKLINATYIMFSVKYFRALVLKTFFSFFLDAMSDITPMQSFAQTVKMYIVNILEIFAIFSLINTLKKKTILEEQ